MGRVLYTFLCFVLQYLGPSLGVAYIYFRYCWFLLNRLYKFIILRISNTIRLEPISSSSSTLRQARKMARRRKTNLILISVTLVFFVSWAPLNILNMFLEFQRPVEVSVYQNYNHGIKQQNIKLTFKKVQNQQLR